MASKIVKPAGAQPDEFELTIGQALLDLESSVPELKQVQLTAAKEVNIIERRARHEWSMYSDRYECTIMRQFGLSMHWETLCRCQSIYTSN